MKNSFLLSEKMTAKADPSMHTETAKNLWCGFSFTELSLSFTDGEENTFAIGDVTPPPLPCGKEYAIKVTESGCAVRGCCKQGLLRGFFDLIMQIGPDYEKMPILKIEMGIFAFGLAESNYLRYCLFIEVFIVSKRVFISVLRDKKFIAERIFCFCPFLFS